MVTNAEVEELIVQLHKEGKGTREISKMAHKNFSFVGAVLKKRFPEEYSDTITITKETQALKLFSLGKTPTQVAIELNEIPESVEKYFNDFLRLERMHSFYNLYRENKGTIPNMLRIHKLLKNRDISPKKYGEVFNLIEKQISREDNRVSLPVVQLYPPLYTPEELESSFHRT
jgi:hypothetical protein